MAETVDKDKAQAKLNLADTAAAFDCGASVGVSGPSYKVDGKGEYTADTNLYYD